MTLAPIRGAPPGAPNPDFPVDNPRAKSAQQTATPALDDQAPNPPVRQRHAPIEIGGGGLTVTFRVIPEQPAIARASLIIHAVVEAAGSTPSHTLGFLRMSASNARAFLAALGNGHSPVVATGDEAGDVQIDYESTKAGPTLTFRKSGERDTSHRSIIDKGFDLKAIASDLLADLGA